jgi:hypothetical protein
MTSGEHGAGLVHPLAAGVEPDVLALGDDRSAAGADLAHGVQLVVVPVRSGLVVVRRGVLFVRTAEIFQQSFLELVAAEVGWNCHVGLLTTSLASRGAGTAPIWMNRPGVIFGYWTLA